MLGYRYSRFLANVNAEDDEEKKKEAEALMRQLDMQLAMQRSKLDAGKNNRLLFRLLGILFVIGFTAILLWILFSYSAQLPDAKPADAIHESPR